MPRIRTMGAGLGGSTAKNVNVNVNTGGGNKKQGLSTTTNKRVQFVTPAIKNRSYGENRNVIFCVNQLGGVGAVSGGNGSRMFGTTSDGVKDCITGPYGCEQVVREAYLEVYKREPDNSGLRTYCLAMTKRKWSKADVIADLWKNPDALAPIYKLFEGNWKMAWNTPSIGYNVTVDEHGNVKYNPLVGKVIVHDAKHITAKFSDNLTDEINPSKTWTLHLGKHNDIYSYFKSGKAEEKGLFWFDESNNFHRWYKPGKKVITIDHDSLVAHLNKSYFIDIIDDIHGEETTETTIFTVENNNNNILITMKASIQYSSVTNSEKTNIETAISDHVLNHIYDGLRLENYGLTLTTYLHYEGSLVSKTMITDSNSNIPVITVMWGLGDNKEQWPTNPLVESHYKEINYGDTISNYLSATAKESGPSAETIVPKLNSIDFNKFVDGALFTLDPTKPIPSNAPSGSYTVSYEAIDKNGNIARANRELILS